ncbi:adenylate/guanylate cyclase domain-containing response regulator [Variovorax sp. YR216]|uniref:adenylate/guanylate cyclase domain-containing protein n=1 Tax=Variovorax sp. YR216 TaxID=1882828 RepID=UPI00089B9A17|nr:adenylate/guanylate cyclase domain-containing response regulator [Variovorax sp. YR216]SEA72649.1 Adenylate and Guanylate cyclase catalytic domain-containing protein [Variovorax sp. YR216]
MNAHILVVDDVPSNVKLLTDILTARGYRTTTATSGEQAMASIAADPPDLVLLDVMMPGMNGYDVCRAIRADPHFAVLPVVLVTALDPERERVNGLNAGADDFLSKPIHQAELMARVRSLLRVKTLYDEVQRQRAELQTWNNTLEQRVAENVQQLERVGQLKRFFSPQLAEAILAGGADDPLKSHRREITVVFLDLRGFTAFTETADPEEVMAVLAQYHAAMGRLVIEHEGTLERFSGDGMMIFFNDPQPVPDAPMRALRMAVRMQREMVALCNQWSRRGYDLHMGVGIAQGFATLGGIGFDGRIDYGAIGTVTNLAARLCGEAAGGEILISQRVQGALQDLVPAGEWRLEVAGELELKGFQRKVPAWRVVPAV